MSKPNTAKPSAGADQGGDDGKSKVAYTPQQALDFLNDILNDKETPITREECFAILKNVDQSDLEEKTLPLFEFEKGKVYNLLFHSVETRMMKGKSNEVATVEDESGSKFITTSVVLINSLRGVTQLPAFCRVECNGKTKTANGEYFDLSVYVFPASK